MTKARDIADFKFENITDTGTEGTKVASGTTAQRGSTAGQIRFNSTTGLAEYYTGTSFKSIDAPPTISSISPTTETNANANIVITGSSFSSGATVKFIGNDGTEYTSPSVTVNSDTQITATTPATPLTVANEPYDVKVTNASGLSGTLADALDAGGSPTWNTASGTIATINDTATGTHATVSATDPDGQTVSYSETTSVLSGQNLTLNSSTGAISGDPTNVNNSTTHTFTLRASDGTNTTDRSFNIIVNPTADGSSSARAATSAVALNNLGITTDGVYWLQPSGGSGSPFQTYCILSKYGGGFVKIAQFYNGANILGTSGAINSGGGWINSAKNLNDGKLANSDIHALQANGTNKECLVTVTDGGSSDTLLHNSNSSTNRGFGLYKFVTGTMPNFGTGAQMSGTWETYEDSDDDGIFEQATQYSGTTSPCGHATSLWFEGHNGGTTIIPSGGSVNHGAGICWTWAGNSWHTNMHFWTGNTSTSSGGSVQWGHNTSNAVAVFIK